MIFTIDIELLQQMASIAQSANDEMDKCMLYANSITGHDDWTCKEREQIIQKLEQFKKRVQLLQEKLLTFSNNFVFAAQRYNDVQGGWLASMSKIDVAISSQLAIPSNNRICNNERMSSLMNDISINQNSNSFNLYTSGSMSEQIKICNFSDFDFTNKE